MASAQLGPEVVALTGQQLVAINVANGRVRTVVTVPVPHVLFGETRPGPRGDELLWIANTLSTRTGPGPTAWGLWSPIAGERDLPAPSDLVLALGVAADGGVWGIAGVPGATHRLVRVEPALGPVQVFEPALESGSV